MIQIMITGEGCTAVTMTFDTMTDALNYINTSHQNEGMCYWLRFYPSEVSKNICPRCGRRSFGYNYTMDDMCCDQCGYIADAKGGSD